jgi:hypothetical protein
MASVGLEAFLPTVADLFANALHRLKDANLSALSSLTSPVVVFVERKLVKIAIRLAILSEYALLTCAQPAAELLVDVRDLLLLRLLHLETMARKADTAVFLASLVRKILVSSYLEVC